MKWSTGSGRSHEGGVLMHAFLPKRIAPGTIERIKGKDLGVVVTDVFICLPKTGEMKEGAEIGIAFTADFLP